MRGLTILEMVIGVAILALLAGLAMPSFSIMLRNSQIRATAEGVAGAINMARAEAIRRNRDVRFAVIKSSPRAIADGVTYCTQDTGNNWAVWVETGGGNRELVDGRVGQEGMNGGSVALSCLTAPGATNAGEIVFNSLGQARELTADAALDFTPPGAEGCAPSGEIRCLRVTISPQGSVRTCSRVANADGVFAKCS